MITPKPDRPYFEAWLRRTGRQLAASGRLTQTAMLLARSEGGTQEEWDSRLRSLLSGEQAPSLDLLTKIDLLLAPPAKKTPLDSTQNLLF